MGLLDSLKALFSSPEPDSPPTVSLEEQLASLEECGVRLNDGVAVDDLLYTFDRSDYEDKPFDTILFVLGIEVEREPWGRYFSNQAWNFDVECIEDHGAYVEIVENFVRITGSLDRVTNLEDYVDIEEGRAWLKYTVDGKDRHFEIPVDDDFADPDTVTEIMADLVKDEMEFYGVDNGQATVWYYLDEASAAKLRDLSNGLLSEVV